MRTTAELKQYRMLASNSPIPMGRIEDVYFDEEAWTIRFFLVETGTWLSERRVMVPMQSIREADWAKHLLRASITQQQVEDSPGIDGRPFSRAHERESLLHYGYPPYWERVGAAPAPEPVPVDRRLRSAHELIGYKVSGIDGGIGHLDALLVDEGGWVIRWLLIKVTHGGMAHRAEVAPEWIEHMDWLSGSIELDLTREQVRDAPRHHPAPQSA